MRVLHLIPSFGSGGAERQLSILAPALAESGVECHIGYCYGGPNLQALSGSNVHLHQFKVAGNHDPRLFLQIWSLIRAVKPDVVQTWLLQMDVLGGIAALLNRVPFILSERASAAAYLRGRKNMLRALMGRYAACIVANSEGGLDYWRPRVSAERLYLIRNAILPARMVLAAPSLEEGLSISEERPIVLFAGRFSHEKNIPVLIESLVLVARQQHDAVFLLFGEGPERELAAQQIANEGLGERMILAGYSPNLAHWMRRAAVCVSVSHFEGHPNVAIEAAAVGCPLVLSDIPAHRELFGNESAVFVPKESPGQVAAAVVNALHNPKVARERADRARVKAAQWNISTATESYCAIYRKLVDVLK
jgi:glycosyltransferase involved in cell wall biosynthesis